MATKKKKKSARANRAQANGTVKKKHAKSNGLAKGKVTGTIHVKANPSHRKQIADMIRADGAGPTAKKLGLTMLPTVMFAAGFGKTQARTLEAVDKYFAK